MTDVSLSAPLTFSLPSKGLCFQPPRHSPVSLDVLGVGTAQNHPSGGRTVPDWALPFQNHRQTPQAKEAPPTRRLAVHCCVHHSIFLQEDASLPHMLLVSPPRSVQTRGDKSRLKTPDSPREQPATKAALQTPAPMTRGGTEEPVPMGLRRALGSQDPHQVLHPKGGGAHRRCTQLLPCFTCLMFLLLPLPIVPLRESQNKCPPSPSLRREAPSPEAVCPCSTGPTSHPSCQKSS